MENDDVELAGRRPPPPSTTPRPIPSVVPDRRSGDGLESPDAIGAVPRRHRSRRRLRIPASRHPGIPASRHPGIPGIPASRRPGVPAEMATCDPSLTNDVYIGTWVSILVP